MPPFNLFLRDVLQYMNIAPSQLHPNDHAFIYGTYLLFMTVFSRPPTPGDIGYIYMVKKRRDSPSFVFLEPHHKCQILTGAWSKFALYKQEWFYVRCPPGFARRWVKGSKSFSWNDAHVLIEAMPFLTLISSFQVSIHALTAAVILRPLKLLELFLLKNETSELSFRMSHCQGLDC